MTYEEMKMAFHRATFKKQYEFLNKCPQMPSEEIQKKLKYIEQTIARLQLERFKPKEDRNETTMDEDFYLSFLRNEILCDSQNN